MPAHSDAILILGQRHLEAGWVHNGKWSHSFPLWACMCMSTSVQASVHTLQGGLEPSGRTLRGSLALVAPALLPGVSPCWLCLS